MTDSLHDQLADALREELHYISEMEGNPEPKSLEALAAYDAAKAATTEPTFVCSCGTKVWLAENNFFHCSICGDSWRGDHVVRSAKAASAEQPDHVAELREVARKMESAAIPGYSHVYAAIEYLIKQRESADFLRSEVKRLTNAVNLVSGDAMTIRRTESDMWNRKVQDISILLEGAEKYAAGCEKRQNEAREEARQQRERADRLQEELTAAESGRKVWMDCVNDYALDDRSVAVEMRRLGKELRLMRERAEAAEKERDIYRDGQRAVEDKIRELIVERDQSDEDFEAAEIMRCKAESRLASLTGYEAIDAVESVILAWDNDAQPSPKMIKDLLAAARKAVGGE